MTMVGDWPRRNVVSGGILITLTLLLAACHAQREGNVDLARWRNADREPTQWMALGGTWRSQRMSPLTKINVENASKLGFAWEYEFRSRRGRVEHGQEATPIFVDGTLYFSGPWGTVAAVDGATGKERWRYDPPVDGSYARRACCDVVNRGLQVWQQKVYVATLDGFLVALDASNGKELWRTDTLIDRDTRSYTVTGPPQVAKDVVVIGNSGGEFGVRGYVTAYELATGKQRWRFYIVPGDPAKTRPEHPEMEMALKTWDPNSDWASGLGGTVWGEMNYDPELNLLYVGTGNSSPYPIWHRSPSGGDNLFLASILAINPDSGRLAWHFQTTPGEIWDYTATQNMILAELEIDGRARKVLMQAPKNGFLYVLDRVTGEFISAKPFVFVNWTTGIDAKGRPTINPAAVYKDKPAAVFPMEAGGHNWEPMAFNTQTGLVYIPAIEAGEIYFNQASYTWRAGHYNLGIRTFMGKAEDAPELDREPVRQALHAQPNLPTLGFRQALVAFDPVKQQERWRVDSGDYFRAGGGVLTTAGNLVIQGGAAGKLVLYRAETGAKLHEVEVGTGIMAAPMSYEIDGEQFIAVLAGLGGAVPAIPPQSAASRYQNYGRLLAFKLGGGEASMPARREQIATPEPPALDGYSDALAARGEELYGEHCAGCHMGKGERQLSYFPDLHRMPPERHATFENIVLGGALSSVGMASFADVLSKDDALAIHSYLIREQRKLFVALSNAQPTKEN